MVGQPHPGAGRAAHRGPALVDAFVGTDWTLAWLAVAQAVLLGILVVAIIGRLFKHQQVTEQTVLAVMCVYVLFGLIFALLAFGVSGITGDQFFVQNPTPRWPTSCTSASSCSPRSGFGDLTPANNAGKAMVSFEALLGQIFLVTVVSRLVSLYTGLDQRSRLGAADGAAESRPPASERARDAAGRVTVGAGGA